MKLVTLILVVLVLATAYPAWRSTILQEDHLADRVGTTLGREGATLEQVARLQVVSWNNETSQAQAFEVKHGEGGWIIPSHHDYPADASEQVGKTAGSVLGVRLGDFVTDQPSQFADLGVLDPMAPGDANDGKGMGRRVTLWDSSGAKLVDVIVGNRAKTGQQTYLREVGSNAVHLANVNFTFSSHFTDWVKRTLVDVTQNDIVALEIDRHSVDEVNQRVLDGPKRLLQRKDADTWTTGEVPEGKDLDQDAVKKLLRTVTGLNISGVRAFQRDNVLSMMAHGFFAVKGGQLFGNEGALRVSTKNGMRYHLYFGEIAAGSGELLSAGSEEENKAAEEKASNGNNRYLAVFVRYDESIDEAYQAALAREAEQAAKAAQPAAEGAEAAKPAEPASSEPTASSLLAAGKKMAEELNRRFTTWFYVIDNSSFLDLRPEDSGLFKDQPKPEASESPAPAQP